MSKSRIVIKGAEPDEMYQEQADETPPPSHSRGDSRVFPRRAARGHSVLPRSPRCRRCC